MSSQTPASPLELRQSPNEQTLQRAHQLLIERGTLPSCVNCDNWSDVRNAQTPGKPAHHPAEICLLWNTRPPAKVIVCGCDRHIPDIPF